jgi:hypothetical protein
VPKVLLLDLSTVVRKRLILNSSRPQTVAILLAVVRALCGTRGADVKAVSPLCGVAAKRRALRC